MDLADDPRTAAAHARGKIATGSGEAAKKLLAELGASETVQDFFNVKGGLSTAAVTERDVILMRSGFRAGAERLGQPIAVKRGPYGFLSKVEIASPRRSVILWSGDSEALERLVARFPHEPREGKAVGAGSERPTLKSLALIFAGLFIVAIVNGVVGDEDPTVAGLDTAAEAPAATYDAEARAEEEAKAKEEAEAKEETEAKAKEEAEAAAAAEKKADAEPKGETATVTNVVDGDTVDLSNGERVRVIGMDTPERGECGFTAARKYMESLVLGKQVNAVPGARDDRDRYDRILRYLNVGKTDAGLALIEKGYANARYDSRDGYGAHPREERYVNADARTADNFVCDNPAPQPAPSNGPAPQPAPEPAPQPVPRPAPPAPGPGAGYTGCRAYVGGPYIDDQGRPYTPIDCETRKPIVP